MTSNKIAVHSSVDLSAVNIAPHGEPSYVSLRSTEFIKMFIYKTLEYAPWIMAGIFLPLYGAQWFGNCLNDRGTRVSKHCEPDWSSYNFYNTLFLSIGGMVSFAFSSVIGRMTDSFGRKPFLVADLVLLCLPMLFMTFHINFWVYWSLDTFTYTNASATATKGYIADIFSSESRMRAFGKLHVSAAIGLVLGVLLVVSITTIWSNHTCFFILVAWYILLTLYTIMVVPETIDMHSNRRLFARQSLKNPFQGLVAAVKHKVMLYIALASLCVAFVEMGIMASLLPYIGTELNLDEDAEANTIFGLYVLIVSVGLVPASGYLLPYLKNVRGMKDENIIILSCLVKIASLIVLAALQIFPNLVVLCISAFVYGASFFSFPAIDGMLTKVIDKKCQGTAFGIVVAYMEVAGIVAPFGFGALYVGTLEYGMQFSFILVAIVFSLIAIWILAVPLKRELELRRNGGERKIFLSFNAMELEELQSRANSVHIDHEETKEEMDQTDDDGISAVYRTRMHSSNSFMRAL